MLNEESESKTSRVPSTGEDGTHWRLGGTLLTSILAIAAQIKSNSMLGLEIERSRGAGSVRGRSLEELKCAWGQKRRHVGMDSEASSAGRGRRGWNVVNRMRRKTRTLEISRIAHARALGARETFAARDPTLWYSRPNPTLLRSHRDSHVSKNREVYSYKVRLPHRDRHASYGMAKLTALVNSR